MSTPTLLFANNAITTLAAGITAASPSLQVLAGAGALFPALGAQQVFIATLIKSGSPNIFEVVLVRGRSGDNFTSLQRNYESNGVGALAWNAGDTVALLPTALGMAFFVQTPIAQAQAFNYAIDTGSANAYIVNLTPALNGSVIGMPIRWMAGHANTGASTFSDGVNTASLITPGVGNLLANNIEAGGIYTVTWDGTTFQLIGNRWRFGQIVGQIANSQVPLSAVQQFQASLAIAFGQLTGQIANAQIPTSVALTGAPSAPTAALGTSTAQLATTAFVNPGSSVGLSGYRKNSDGTIEQWGQINVASGLGAPQDFGITFPNTFPTACISVHPVTNRRVAVANQAVDGSNFASQITTTGATITIDNNSLGNFIASWRALGW